MLAQKLTTRNAYTATLLAAGLTPFLAGILAGECGKPADAAQYDYDGDRAEYSEGFNSATSAVTEEK